MFRLLYGENCVLVCVLCIVHVRAPAVLSAAVSEVTVCGAVHASAVMLAPEARVVVHASACSIYRSLKCGVRYALDGTKQYVSRPYLLTRKK